MSLLSRRNSHALPVTSCRFSLLAQILAAPALAAIFLIPAFAQTVPDNLKPPADQHLVFRAHATGDQIYACQPGTDSQLAWVLSGPEARLTDAHGKEVAKHFAGPIWQSTDGSQVKGKVVNHAAPDPNSIPWLLLTAVDHTGSGVMSNVESIQRLNTKGGTVPASGCDASHQGDKVRVNYSADYYFYTSK